MKVGLKQISEMTGFSLATVSNVLNFKKGVHPETAKIVLQVAKDVGYLDDITIKTIKLVIFKTHGFVIDDTPFFGALMEGVEQECRAKGYSLEIVNLNQKRDDYEEVLESILRDFSAALLILATELTEEDLAVFEQSVSPIVILDNWFSSMQYSAVLINNVDSIRQAVNYCTGKGHRDIGFIQSSVNIKNFAYRKQGYLEGLAENDIPCRDDFIVPAHPTMDGAYQDMLAFLETEPQLPTVFIADNDLIALGAIRALRQKEYRVPEEVSIIGFDNVSFGEISSPMLTTIHVYKHEMGALAVHQLSELIDNRAHNTVKIELSTEFIERESVRSLEEEPELEQGS